MKVLHFGAGNIGRGFIGKIWADAGYEVIFADVNQPLLDLINEKQQYDVRIVGDGDSIETVNLVSAINSTDENILSVIAEVDFITTAVGPLILEKIAPTVAKGITKRLTSGITRPLNIIACENMIKATSAFKEFISTHLANDILNQLDDMVGFVDSAVDRIIPPILANENNPLLVTVETFCEWIVDKTQFVGQVPEIAGMQTTDNLMAFIERKLFTLNTGHTITAYLGQAKGINTIREAILDEKIRAIAISAMKESGAVLISRYKFDKESHDKYIDKIISRFENPYLLDDVTRVGRQPIRKLSLNERLIKPLLGTLEYQLPNTSLLIGVVACLHFKCADDPQVAELEQSIHSKGLNQALSDITGLEPHHELLSLIITQYNQGLSI